MLIYTEERHWKHNLTLLATKLDPMGYTYYSERTLSDLIATESWTNCVGFIELDKSDKTFACYTDNYATTGYITLEEFMGEEFTEPKPITFNDIFHL